jgi:hypothetical protein
MSKGILWTIKIVAIIFAMGLITIAKEAGIPIIVGNLIGFGIIIAVWKYKPDEPNDNNNDQKLDKS